MAIVAGLTLSLFNSITKNIFWLAVFLLYFFDGSCFLTPGLPPHSKAGGSLVNAIVIVFGAVAYFTGRLY